MNRRIALRLSVTAAVLYASGALAPAFASDPCTPHTPFSYRAGTDARDFTFADVDGDADFDAVFVTKIGGLFTLLVLENDGLGTFTAAQSTAIAGATNPRGIVAGDVDGDLDVDLAIASDLTSIRVWKNTGGTFAPASAVTTPSTLSRALLVDLDGDTDLDLVNSMQVWSNDGTGAFTFVVGLTQTSAMDWVTAGDYDGDGDIDVCGARGGGSAEVRTWTNGGAFTFTGSSVAQPIATVMGLESGDLDGDTLVDRIVVRTLDARVYLGTGTVTVLPMPASHSCSGSGLGDVDGDSDLDLVCADGDLQVFVNSGGTFTVGPRFAGGATRVLVAELDGDGANDIASAARFLSTFSARLTRKGLADVDLLDAQLVDQLSFVDLDGDGLRDALGRASDATRPSVWRNTGGGFVATSFQSIQEIGAIRAIDMNGDGRPEVVRADTFAPAIEMSFNAGGMSFSTFFGQDSGVVASDIAHGDLDHDGDQDIVVVPSSLFASSMYALENDGTGLLTPTPIPISFGGGMCVEVADVDGDTWLDVVVTTRGSSDGIYVLVNDGAGTLTAPVQVGAFDSDFLANALAVADLDRDGDVDLLVGTRGQGEVHVLENDGSGSFTLAQRVACDFEVIDLHAVALDGGAAPDLCVVEGSLNPSSPGRVSVWSNLGDGTFAYRSTHVPAAGVGGCAFADLDFDGRNEIYLSSRELGFTAFWGRIQRFAYTGGCSAGTPICAGDGSLAPCPCGNSGSAGNGCANSVFSGGARLSASGVASVAHDTLLLECGDMTGNTCIFVQGSTLTAPMALDDGLTCVGSIVRLGSRSVIGATSVFPQLGNASVSQRGAIPPSGGTYHYQSYYRNASTTFCPPATSNRTNGLTITWAP